MAQTGIVKTQENKAFEVREAVVSTQIDSINKAVKLADKEGKKNIKVGSTHGQSMFLETAVRFALKGYDIKYPLKKTGDEEGEISWENFKKGKRGTFEFC